jgi:hypothetical protein
MINQVLTITWRVRNTQRAIPVSVVPALSRDPYAVAVIILAQWSMASFNNRRPGLWVPAFAGTMMSGDVSTK